MKVIDLFSGAGGFSKGLEQCGYDVVLANELEPQIAETFQKNHPETLMVNLDINKFVEDIDGCIAQALAQSSLNKSKILNDLNNIDLIVGGPPCQGFSMAGDRIRKNKTFLNDPRNFLFKSYFKMIQKFEPKYFLFENVVGLLSMNNGDILNEIKSLFEDETNFNNGRYHISVKVFDARDFGVPQARKRVILLGAKQPLAFDDMIPATLAKLTATEREKFVAKPSVADAISDLNYLQVKEGEFKQAYSIEPESNYQKILRNGNQYLYNHIAPNHTELALSRIKQIEIDQNWTNLKEKDDIKSVHSGAYGRLCWTKPTKTITTRFDTPSGGRFIHPELHRTITPREAARIQSFPDDFIFYGSKSSVCKQIGNAVPPLLAEFLGLMLRNNE